MKANKFLAAAFVFLVAGAAFAADAPMSSAAPTAGAASAADKLNLPAATAGRSPAIDRATVKAEAAQFVQNHKTTLAVQLEQYKN